MNRTLFNLFLLVFVGSSFYSAAQSSKLTIAKVPSWVTSLVPDYNNRKLEADAEDGYFDLAFEKQVSLIAHARYYKKVIKILSDAGVQNSSEISINFDPGYEHLILHSIHIIRGGVSIDKLQLSKFKVIQQERDLERHLYDGGLTALLVLDDVRKGDIIESCYSINGFNPIFNNKYSDTYSLNFSVPIGSLYYKLIAPASNNIYIKNRNTDLLPGKTIIGSQTTFEWKNTNIEALRLEAKTPGWYSPYSEVMISEYKDWNDVSTWANNLFNRNVALSPSLREKINQIIKANPTEEGRVLDALHFVQDNIRYMGIEMGVNSHKPAEPNKIFNQRFGDCKDKSYLLVTMLKAMGIASNPVLISTTDKTNVMEMSPSPSCFDHCTVQAIINTKTYWFDPTISFQRGNLNDISFPNYKAGLVVSDTVTGLSAIPFHENGSSIVKEYFEIPDMTGRAYFKVVTKMTGSVADDARDNYNNNSLNQIKTKYKDFYAFYFDKIIADSLTYQNNDSSGTFTTTEYYTIDDIWKTENGEKKLSLSSYVISSVLTQPADKNRHMPFYQLFPANYIEHIELSMPDDWSVKESDDEIVCAGFKFSAKSRAVRNHVFLDYKYQSLKDNISPAESKNYFARYREASDATGFELIYNDNKTSNYTSTSRVSSTPKTGLFPKLYALLGVAVLITFLIRRQRQNQY